MNLNFMTLLDRPIAFHRVLVDITGSVYAGLFLSQAIYWSGRCSEDGWFYKTCQEWQEETGLSRRDQDTCRNRLKDLGLLTERKSNFPIRLWFSINQAKLQDLLLHQNAKMMHQNAKMMHQNAKLDAPKRQNECTETPNWMHRNAKLDAPKRQIFKGTETTTETTAETTAETTNKNAGKPAIDFSPTLATTFSPTPALAHAERKLQAAIAIEPDPSFQLPDWIPTELWEGFKQHRIAIKAPLTPYAAKLLVRELEKLRDSGQDAVAVIEQTIMSGKWKGFYAIKPDNPTANETPRYQRGNQAAAEEAARRIKARYAKSSIIEGESNAKH